MSRLLVLMRLKRAWRQMPLLDKFRLIVRFAAWLIYWRGLHGVFRRRWQSVPTGRVRPIIIGN